MRHPNVSLSFRAVSFHVTAVTDPAVAIAAAEAAAAKAAAAATMTATTGGGSVAAALAQVGPALNPLLQPRVSLLVSLPAITAAQYGGEAKLLADFKIIVAATAALTGPDWALASLVNATPAVVNATVCVHLRLVASAGLHTSVHAEHALQSIAYLKRNEAPLCTPACLSSPPAAVVPAELLIDPLCF